MTTLTLIKNKSVEEEIEDIDLPNYDIIIHEVDTWFDDKIKEIEELKRITERDRGMDN